MCQKRAMQQITKIVIKQFLVYCRAGAERVFNDFCETWVNNLQILLSEEQNYFMLNSSPLTFIHSAFKCRYCTYITSYFSHGEDLTLWFYSVQNRLGPSGGSCSQGSGAALCYIHHSLQQGHIVFGAAVGAGNHLVSWTDQGQVAHSGNNILGKKKKRTSDPPLLSLTRHETCEIQTGVHKIPYIISSRSFQ